MKQINKIAQPNTLVEHSNQQHSNYNNIPQQTKEDVRQNLLYEQGHICCYCMKRIPEKVETDGRVSYEVKIEHFKSQDSHPQHQLLYSILLASCTGNEGQPNRLQTCDTKKAHQELTIDVTSNAPNCETLIKYNADGEISSVNDDENINHQLNNILNLNMQTLKQCRREAYLEIQLRVRNESKRLNNNRIAVLNFLTRERDRLLQRNNSKYKAFCMVAVYYLNTRIIRNQ